MSCDTLEEKEDWIKAIKVQCNLIENQSEEKLLPAFKEGSKKIQKKKLKKKKIEKKLKKKKKRFVRSSGAIQIRRSRENKDTSANNRETTSKENDRSAQKERGTIKTNHHHAGGRPKRVVREH